jgi:alkaline phosphatase
MANALELDRSAADLSADAAVELSDDTVKPGAEITATASGFAGDRQLGGVVESEPVTLPTSDVIDGAATFTVTAPAEKGKHTVTLTGAQTGTEVVATFTVSADATTTPPATEPGTNPTDAPTGEPTAGAGAGGGSGTTPGGTTIAAGLATTGVLIAPLGALAAGLLTLGALLLVRHRRQHGGNTAA